MAPPFEIRISTEHFIIDIRPTSTNSTYNRRRATDIRKRKIRTRASMAPTGTEMDFISAGEAEVEIDAHWGFEEMKNSIPEEIRPSIAGPYDYFEDQNIISTLAHIAKRWSHTRAVQAIDSAVTRRWLSAGGDERVTNQDLLDVYDTLMQEDSANPQMAAQHNNDELDIDAYSNSDSTGTKRKSSPLDLDVQDPRGTRDGNPQAKRLRTERADQLPEQLPLFYRESLLQTSASSYVPSTADAQNHDLYATAIKSRLLIPSMEQCFSEYVQPEISFEQWDIQFLYLVYWLSKACSQPRKEWDRIKIWLKRRCEGKGRRVELGDLQEVYEKFKNQRDQALKEQEDAGQVINPYGGENLSSPGQCHQAKTFSNPIDHDDNDDNDNDDNDGNDNGVFANTVFANHEKQLQLFDRSNRRTIPYSLNHQSSALPGPAPKTAGKPAYVDPVLGPSKLGQPKPLRRNSRDDTADIGANGEALDGAPQPHLKGPTSRRTSQSQQPHQLSGALNAGEDTNQNAAASLGHPGSPNPVDQPRHSPAPSDGLANMTIKDTGRNKAKPQTSKKKGKGKKGAETAGPAGETQQQTRKSNRLNKDAKADLVELDSRGQTGRSQAAGTDRRLFDSPGSRVRRRPGTHYREPPPAFRRQTQEASAHRPTQSRGGNLLQAAQEQTAEEAVDASRQRGQVPQGETLAPSIQQQRSQREQQDSRSYFPRGCKTPAEVIALHHADRERERQEKTRRENATLGISNQAVVDTAADGTGQQLGNQQTPRPISRQQNQAAINGGGALHGQIGARARTMRNNPRVPGATADPRLARNQPPQAPPNRSRIPKAAVNPQVLNPQVALNQPTQAPPARPRNVRYVDSLSMEGGTRPTVSPSGGLRGSTGLGSPFDLSPAPPQRSMQITIRDGHRRATSNVAPMQLQVRPQTQPDADLVARLETAQKDLENYKRQRVTSVMRYGRAQAKVHRADEAGRTALLRGDGPAAIAANATLHDAGLEARDFELEGVDLSYRIDDLEAAIARDKRTLREQGGLEMGGLEGEEE